jgi:hypothetical protein
MRYDLTDFEWSVIEPLLPNKALAHRCAVARPAGALRALYDLLQLLQPLAQGWGVGPDYGRDHRGLRRYWRSS